VPCRQASLVRDLGVAEGEIARPPDQEASIMNWWQQAKRSTPKHMRKGLASAALLIPWMIWKQRDGCIFEGAQQSAPTLITKIKDSRSMGKGMHAE